MALKKLTKEQAADRLEHLCYTAGRDLADSLDGVWPNVSVPPQAIEELREIARVASQVAKHYEDRL